MKKVQNHCSKDSYYSLESKKSLSQNIGSWHWHPVLNDIIQT